MRAGRWLGVAAVVAALLAAPISALADEKMQEMKIRVCALSLTQAMHQALRDGANLEKASETLATIVHGIVVTDGEDEMEIIEMCLDNLSSAPL